MFVGIGDKLFEGPSLLSLQDLILTIQILHIYKSKTHRLLYLRNLLMAEN